MLVDRVGGGEPLPEQLQPPGAHALWLNSRLWLTGSRRTPGPHPSRLWPNWPHAESRCRRRHSLPSLAKPERVEVYASSPAGGFVPPVRPSSVGRVVFSGTRAASASPRPLVCFDH